MRTLRGVILAALLASACDDQASGPWEQPNIALDVVLSAPSIGSGESLVAIASVVNRGPTFYHWVDDCGDGIVRFDLRGPEGQLVQFIPPGPTCLSAGYCCAAFERGASFEDRAIFAGVLYDRLGVAYEPPPGRYEFVVRAVFLLRDSDRRQPLVGERTTSFEWTGTPPAH